MMIFKCQSCHSNAIFPDKDKLKHHIIKSHANILWETTMNQKDEATSTNVDDLKYAVEQLKFACTNCPARFFTSTRLNVHIINNHTNKVEQLQNFPCHSCPDRFLTRIRLLDHIKTAHSKGFPCIKCKEIFATTPDLDNHMMHAHVRPAQPMNTIPDPSVARFRVIPAPEGLPLPPKRHGEYLCKVCKYRTSSRAELIEHMSSTEHVIASQPKF